MAIVVCRKPASITSTLLETCFYPSNPNHLAPEGSPLLRPLLASVNLFISAFITQPCNCMFIAFSNSQHCNFLAPKPVHPQLLVTSPLPHHCRFPVNVYTELNTHAFHICYSVFHSTTTHFWQVESYCFPERQYRVVAESVGSRGQPGPCHVRCALSQVTQYCLPPKP